MQATSYAKLARWAADPACLALADWLEPFRSAFPRHVRIGLVTVERQRYLIDTKASRIVQSGWSEDVDAVVFANQRTLTDLATGAFDPRRSVSERFFVCTGDRSAWDSFMAVVADALALRAVRASQEQAA